MREEKGFTFLEIMVAVAILSIALVAALRTQSQSILIANESITNTNLLLLAKEKMAEIELDGFPEIGESEGTFEKHPEFHWKVEVKEANINIEPDNKESDKTDRVYKLRQVILTISWKEGSRERNYIIQTMISNKDKLF